MKKYLIVIYSLLCISYAQAQGDIDHIKNQPYLKLTIDCNCTADSCVSSIRNRYCANLEFQKTDSLLTISYDSLLVLMNTFSTTDSLSTSFILLQGNWRAYRQMHCKEFWKDPDCNSNHCGTLYLMCMKYITEIRLTELDQLIEYYTNQIDSLKESEVPIKSK